MERNIVQIGNSMGVILPASILKRLNLSAKDPVTITHRNNSIIIKPVPRRNWEAAASQMHAAGDDNLIMPDIFEYGYNYSLDIDTHSLSLAGEVYFRRKRGYDSHRPDSDCR